MMIRYILILSIILITGLLSFTWSTPKTLDFKGIMRQDSVSLRHIHQQAFHVSEYFLFDIDWGFINAGNASLELLPVQNHENLWKIRSLAWGNSFFQSFYPVQDTIFSIINKEGIYPIHFEKNIHEGSYETHIRNWFDQRGRKGWLQDTIVDLPPFTHDVLSAFYYIRSQKLKVGNTYELNAVSGKNIYRLIVFCHRKETVTVPAGTFETVVIEPKIKGDGLFRTAGKETLLIWLTDDKRHMPVKMTVKIPVGSITASLIKYKE